MGFSLGVKGFLWDGGIPWYEGFLGTRGSLGFLGDEGFLGVPWDTTRGTEVPSSVFGKLIRCDRQGKREGR